LTGANFVNQCIQIDVEGDRVTVAREIDGGKENMSTSFPLVIGGQKGIVHESDLRIPNMRGIMQARTKPLRVIDPVEAKQKTKSVRFEKPVPKGAVKLAQNVDELIDLLHNDAKVI
jgi:electron transfer flavoprotein beta subunit